MRRAPAVRPGSFSRQPPPPTCAFFIAVSKPRDAFYARKPLAQRTRRPCPALDKTNPRNPTSVSATLKGRGRGEREEGAVGRMNVSRRLERPLADEQEQKV